MAPRANETSSTTFGTGPCLFRKDWRQHCQGGASGGPGNVPFVTLLANSSTCLPISCIATVEPRCTRRSFCPRTLLHVVTYQIRASVAYSEEDLDEILVRGHNTGSQLAPLEHQLECQGADNQAIEFSTIFCKSVIATSPTPPPVRVRGGSLGACATERIRSEF